MHHYAGLIKPNACKCDSQNVFTKIVIVRVSVSLLFVPLTGIVFLLTLPCHMPNGRLFSHAHENILHDAGDRKWDYISVNNGANGL